MRCLSLEEGEVLENLILEFGPDQGNMSLRLDSPHSLGETQPDRGDTPQSVGQYPCVMSLKEGLRVCRLVRSDFCPLSLRPGFRTC